MSKDDQLEKLCKSDVHKRILLLFHQNPALVDTPRGIAAWIGLDREDIKSAVDDLVRYDILISITGSTTTGYAYTTDKRLLDRIAKILKSNK